MTNENRQLTPPRRTGCQPILLRLTPEMPCPKVVDLCYTVSKQEITMDAAENQIVVYQPNETVRLDVRMKCCQCENVASSQFQFPMKEVV